MSFIETKFKFNDEGELTFLKIIGLLLIVGGLLLFLYATVCESRSMTFLNNQATNRTFYEQLIKDSHNAVASKIAGSFFIVMVGFSFVFPTLLEGNDGISTMRIAVFMMVNVICMLLIKSGWNAKSLSEIGIDQYWLGIIAFVFGAKATQTYFENAKNFIGQPKTMQAPESQNELDISPIAIAQIAKVQNENKLQALFPNIISVSDTLLDGKSCLTLYLEDNNKMNIPEYVTAEINEKTNIEVKTEIISNCPAATTHIGQASDDLSDSINPDGFASFCALLTNPDNPDLRFLATAGHNFTKGNFKTMGGFVYNDEQRNVLINGKIKGSLFYQRMHFTQDLAIVKLNETENLLNNYISFKNGYKELCIADVKTKVPNVTIASRINENRIGSNIRDAFVLDINIPFDVMYNGEKRRFQNMILLGNTNEKEKSSEVSMRGDSGSCVYCNKTKRLVGILIGGNGKYSFVLPIKDVLETNNFKVI